MTSLQLPAPDALGQVAQWYLPLPHDDQGKQTGRTTEVGRLDLDDYEYLIFNGQFIGHHSSHTPNHWDHPTDQYISGRARCNACRWFEIRIFREFTIDDNDDDDESFDLETAFYDAKDEGSLGPYIVYKVGMSIVPGEVPYCRYDEIPTPYQLIEAMTTRRITPENGQQVFMTKPSAMALAAAAQYDADLETAYINRAVV